MSYKRDAEGRYVRSVTCNYCWTVGHNILSCPKRREDLPVKIKEHKKEAKKFSRDKESWDYTYHTRRLERLKEDLDQMNNLGKNRKCGYEPCREAGHNRSTCPKRKADTERVTRETIDLRKHVAFELEKRGFGIGSLVDVTSSLSARGRTADTGTTSMAVVTGVNLQVLYPEHKYGGYDYFYPPEIIEYRLVCPVPDRYGNRIITDGFAHVPIEFLNVDDHTITEGARARHASSTAELVSKVESISVPLEVLDWDTISNYVRDKYVDPRKKRS